MIFFKNQDFSSNYKTSPNGMDYIESQAKIQTIKDFRIALMNFSTIFQIEKKN